MNAPAAGATARVEAGALVALLVGACAIAFAPIFVRLSDVGPTATAFWRVALALPFLWGWAAMSRGREPAGRTFALPVVIAGLCFAGDLGVWHISILFTSVANATLLANLAPIFVAVGGYLLFRQRVTPLFLVGMVTALAGAFVLVGPSFASGSVRLLGDALGVLTAVFYGGYFLAVKYLRDSRSTGAIMAASTTVSAIVLLPIAIAAGESLFPASPWGWLILFGLALVCQSGGQGLIVYAMAHLPASFSAVSLLLQPVMATLYAWVLLGEKIGPAQFVGGAIVLVGIYVARRGS